MRTDKSDWVVHRVLAGQVAARGDRPFLQLLDRPPLTFVETDTLSCRLANGLLEHDIVQGENVAVMVPNSIEACPIWFALSCLGAVNVSVNTAYKGAFLSHLLNNAGPRLMFIAADYLPWLAKIEEEVPTLVGVFVPGGTEQGEQSPLRRIRAFAFGSLLEAPAAPIAREVSRRELGGILYTSGTTGPPKGVLMPSFAVPRYVEFMEALPRTPTEKVRKAQLRERGLTPATWEREAAG
jgi:crotonobetaine/carnitine-CoA ligase